jgi:aminomethyltransferase
MANRTHLYPFHAQNGEIVDFAGFAMPMWYKSIVTEALAVRNAVGIFDVSHMGRALVSGDEAESYLNFATTNDVSSLREGQAHYSLLCNELGGIKDDILVYRLGGTKFLAVFNAGNRRKDTDWLIGLAKHHRVDFQDVSDSVAMFAVQGPKAGALLERLCNLSLSTIARFANTEVTVQGIRCLASRTGYTGEDGFEIFVWDAPLDRPDYAVRVWHGVLEAGKDLGIQPCGLGARDLLRLEAGMCLYGNDIDENTNPLEAKLGFVVKLQKPGFVGKEAIEEVKTKGPGRARIGLKLLEKGIPRAGQEIESDGKIGQTTSGSFSPILNTGIAMGYVAVGSGKEGTQVSVRIRDRKIPAMISKFPLYDTTKYGWQRAN